MVTSPVESPSPVSPDLLDQVFPRYTGFDPVVPVWCVTPDSPRTIHRFFDTSPLSPSGRYLGLIRFPYEDRVPFPGDPAEIVVVDLVAGRTEVVATTRGWDTQLGAQVQWGADDQALFFNDLDPQTWHPYGVRLDPTSGHRTSLAGTVYMVSPDGSQALSPCLRRTGRTQKGYGVRVPPDQVPLNRGAPADDGVWITDTSTGATALLVSIERMVDELGLPSNGDRDCYVFHVKWTDQSDRIMVVLRWIPREPPVGPGDDLRPRLSSLLVTMRPDGSELKLALPEQIWARGGHHPQWCPDGQTILMNLKLDGQTLRFVTMGYDGHHLSPLTEKVLGSGHPSLHPDRRHLITDTYLHEPLAFGDGTVPIRLVDIVSGQETTLVRIHTQPQEPGPARVLRVDPHPVWDRGYRYVTFNACPNGTRAVFLADLTGLLDPATSSHHPPPRLAP